MFKRDYEFLMEGTEILHAIEKDKFLKRTVLLTVSIRVVLAQRVIEIYVKNNSRGFVQLSPKKYDKHRVFEAEQFLAELMAKRSCESKFRLRATWMISGKKSLIKTVTRKENKRRLQTLSIDNAWSNKNFLGGRVVKSFLSVSPISF